MTYITYPAATLGARIATGATSFIAAALFSTVASATPVLDTYIGGVANFGGVDVIGHAAEFDIISMDAHRVGDRLRVVVNTNFAGQSGHYAAYTKNGKGIGYGDLFLADAWQPFGVGPGYLLDTATTGTHWRYGFALNDSVAASDRYHDAGGTGFLYALNGATNDADDLISDDFIKNAIWRNNQVVAVDLAAPTIQRLGAGTWAVDAGAHTVSFDIDLTGTTLLDDNTLALHWAMLCANDVIEGRVSVPVPERQITSVPAPETASLLGVGALALLVVRRKRATR